MAQQRRRIERRRARTAAPRSRASETAPAGTVDPSVIPGEQWFPVAVVTAALGVYLNTLLNGFVWDDLYLVVNNTHIKSWASIPSLFTEALFPRTQYYRPFQALTFALDYHAWGLAAAGFHVMSAILHAGVAWMLYRLTTRILRDPLAGVVAALLFAVHPIHGEAVAYLSGRSDPLAALGLLAALLWSESHLLLSAGAFFAALLARESAGVFLPLAILVDATGVLRRVGDESGLTRRRLVRYGAYIAVVAVYLVLRSISLGDEPVVIGTAGVPLGTRLLTTVKVLGAYLGLLAVPAHLHMERIIPPVTSVFEPGVIGSAALLAFIATLVIVYRQSAWPIAFGCAWFVIAFLPVSNVMPLDAFMAEHWLYVPSMGLFIAAGWGIAQLMRGRAGTVVSVAFVGALLAYGARTVWRNAEWRSEAAIFEATLRDSPTSTRAASNLGRVYLEAGDATKAEELLLRALALKPRPGDLAGLHNNLALAYYQQDRYGEAVKEFEEALRLDSSDPSVYTNFAVSLLEIDRRDDAVRALERAIAINPQYAPAYSNLGLVLNLIGQRERAKEAYERAIALDPDSGEAYAGLGEIYLDEGHPELAETALRTALGLLPDSPVVREALDKAVRARAAAR